MKVPSEPQNRGKQVCHRVLLEDTWLTQQWVSLPTDASPKVLGPVVRRDSEKQDGV